MSVVWLLLATDAELKQQLLRRRERRSSMSDRINLCLILQKKTFLEWKMYQRHQKTRFHSTVTWNLTYCLRIFKSFTKYMHIYSLKLPAYFSTFLILLAYFYSIQSKNSFFSIFRTSKWSKY